ncbi:hypothetical protein GF314_04665, partial [bacterium]|nr:hypothetical protein [bacterium]
MTSVTRFDRHRDEVLRWNRQMSLVSRVDPEPRVDALVRECRAAWTLLRAAGVGDAAPEATVWIDLGSGAGFPGVVWAIEREHGGGIAAPGKGLLVEPREKRAWFLNRCLRTLDLACTSVLAARWGAGPAVQELGGLREAIISLKAIRL